MMPQITRLIAASLRYSWAEVVAPGRRFFLILFVAVTAGSIILALQDPEHVGIVPYWGFWIGAAPFCRSWYESDVLQGRAAFWFQRQTRPAELYGARLLSLMILAWTVALALSLAAMPGLIMGGHGLQAVLGAIVSLSWVAPFLVILAFTGAALGMRSGALFGYGMLLGGVVLRGVMSGLELGPVYRYVAWLFPAYDAAFGSAIAADRGEYVRALGLLWPLALYALACMALALALAGRAPGRLARRR